MTAPQRPKKPEVVTRTMFTVGSGDQWAWETKSLDNTVISGEGGYAGLQDAINGYFAQQGITYGMNEKWPSDYGPLQRLQENQYQINKFVTN